MDIDPATKGIPDEFLQKLGALAINWGLIDRLISHLFIGLIDGEPGSMYVITESISAKTISEWVSTLLKSRPIEDEQLGLDAVQLINDIQGERATRNALIHGIWNPRSAEPGSVLVITVKLERAAPIKEEVITLHDLNQAITDAHDFIVRLHRVMLKLGCAVTD